MKDRLNASRTFTSAVIEHLTSEDSLIFDTGSVAIHEMVDRAFVPADYTLVLNHHPKIAPSKLNTRYHYVCVGLE
jgi:hypothetical protein